MPAQYLPQSSQGHLHVGSYSDPSQFPNVSGSPYADSGLIVGALAFSTATNQLYQCVDATMSSAVWELVVVNARFDVVIPGAFPYTPVYTDLVVNIDTTAARIIQLPDPSATIGVFWLKDASGLSETNNISVLRFAGENIQGLAATAILAGNWSSWGFYSDGANWWIL